MTLKRLCAALLCFAVPLGLHSGHTQAQGAVGAPGVAVTLPLVPLQGRGFVTVIALVVRAQLDCTPAQCALDVAQTYHFHNSDRVKPATLALGLGVDVGADANRTGQSMAAHRLEGELPGATLTPEGAEAAAPRWTVTLQPNEQRLVRVVSRHALGESPFVQWRYDMSRLTAWGTLTGARVTLRLPTYMTDDALFSVTPPASSFDGYEMVWDYEELARPSGLSWTAVSPPAWERLCALEQGDDPLALARHLAGLRDAASTMGLGYPDPYERILAASHAALQSRPDLGEVHEALANLYIDRAGAWPSLQLNYLLLAAREMEALRAQRPQDAALAARLSATYVDAARLASGEGDPATALQFLEKAEAAGGTSTALGSVIEELKLQWALDLAEGGQVGQALAELGDDVAPDVRAELFHYAPPFVGIRTDVVLRVGTGWVERAARYQWRLYGPTLTQTMATLSRIAQRLAAQPYTVASIVLDEGALTADMVVSVSGQTREQVQVASASVPLALAAETGLVGQVVMAPWRGEGPMIVSKGAGLRDTWRYEESVDLSGLNASWAEEAQYIDWRMVELRAQAREEGRAGWLHRLSLLVLQEQAQTWYSIPSGSFWMYRVEPEPPWSLYTAQVAWGSRRDLAAEQSVLLWRRVLLFGAGVLGIVLGVGGLWALRRKSQRMAARAL